MAEVYIDISLNQADFEPFKSLMSRLMAIH